MSTDRVITTISNKWGPALGETYRAVNRGNHRGYRGDYRNLVDSTRALVGKLAELR